jgi:hypothetical protein
VSVVTRDARSASGRVTLFSVLNVEAARLAREGDHRDAATVAEAAGAIEAGDSFRRIKQLLTGRTVDEVSAFVDGGAREEDSPELLGLLRLVAAETRATRGRMSARVTLSEVVTGRISEEQASYCVLTAESGARTAVPRWLADAAKRGRLGDCLALVTEKLGAQQLVVNALPGLEMSEHTPAVFSPFGRSARVNSLTRADASRLARKPAPLTIVVPVSIGA